jgi:L-ascorbate metabolism protein UlaG (beta-lactamase superfamily)
MSPPPLFLRPDVVAEPLVGRWYAWTHLVFPATHAMYVANSHTRLMQSFVTNPGVHVAALKNPAMLGGPFINHPPERAPEVAELLRQTLERQRPQLELAEAIKAFDAVLAARADGHSLEPLYAELPAALKGLVELVYDVNHRASIRFIEPLLYQSRFHDRSLQTVMLRRIGSDEERPFVFSTPRLHGEPEKEAVELTFPFADPRYDALFAARTMPVDVAELSSTLEVPEERRAAFAALFTAEAPRPAERYDGAGMRVRYLGHACLLIETSELTVLVDPVLGYQHGSGPERVGISELPERIDFVLLTHNHLDHVIFEVLLELRRRVGTVVVPRSTGGTLIDPSLSRILRSLGFNSVVELDDMDVLPLPGGELTALPFLGEHADLDVRTKNAYLLRSRGRSVMAVADLNNVEPEVYDLVRQHTGPTDVLFIGMECEGAPLSWSYGALLTRPLNRRMDQSRRFSGSNCRSALELVNRFGPREVYVYAMGQEPWLTFLTSIRYTPESKPIVESDQLVAECRRRGLQAERLFGIRDRILAPA